MTDAELKVMPLTVARSSPTCIYDPSELPVDFPELFFLDFIALQILVDDKDFFPVQRGDFLLL